MIVRDSLKVKVNIPELIRKLEARNKFLTKDYRESVDKHNKSIAKYYLLLADKIREVANKVEEGKYKDIENGYREDIIIKIKGCLPLSPENPRQKINNINNTINILKLSNDETIVLKQSEYDNLFQ